MANILTGTRIICGLVILVCPAFSKWFYIVYLLGGLTDALDGTVARKQGKATDFGAKFDTIADFVFAVTVLIKVVDALVFPTWLLVWIIAVIVIKLAAVAVGFVKYHRFVTVHSVLNKACGLAAFTVPLFIGRSIAWQIRMLAVLGVCVLATVAAVLEFISILRSGPGTGIEKEASDMGMEQYTDCVIKYNGRLAVITGARSNYDGEWVMMQYVGGNSVFSVNIFEKGFMKTLPDPRYGLIKRRGKDVIFAYNDTDYELTDYPYEPCMYIKKDGKTFRTLHNAFTAYDLPEWFAEGKTLTAIDGKVYDQPCFCRVLASAIDSDRSDMDFTFAAGLVK